MRTIKLLLLSLGLAAVACAMQSCLDDDNDHYYNIVMPNALVTVKPAAGNTGFYLQLDDSTTLKPVNMSQSPFGNRQVRALVNYSTADQDPAPYKQAVRINWIDSILTKPLAKDLGDDNPATYGNDPVEIVNDWVTIAEDGYLTLRVRTLMSGQVKHIVNLVATPTADNAYVVTFYQDAQGDVYGVPADALVAFDLAGSLPDTGGKTVDLVLKWNSYSGAKQATFKYCSRKAGTAGISLRDLHYSKWVK
ncbi:MAG: NigD-like protein [Bacteroidales bacterium]|jgi:hypothetical protein|nr:NigD-like protein [Muribaculaceae bacterium]MDY6251915.1 NigD-like protein [Bacteroidales bacterium]MDY6259616.1 NigD-like protein [Bacteroidales bacterium]